MDEQTHKARLRAHELGKDLSDPDRAREMQKLGAQKRRENTARKKDLQKTIKWFMDMAVSKKELLEPEDIMDIASTKGENLTVNEAIVFSQIIKAINGDTQAAVFLRDNAGEKPKDQIEVAGPTIDEYAQSHKVKL